MSDKDGYDIVLLPGDGIGVEIAEQARRVLDTVARATGVTFQVEEIPCGGQFYLEHGARDWPEGSEEKCAAADVILLGAVGWPSPTGTGPVTMPDGKMAGWSPVIGNRTRLNLYANVRKVKLLPGVRHRISGRHQQVWQPGSVDMVFVRENTEDLYAGMGGTLAPGGRAVLATDTRVITRAASERVIRYAFELCRRRDRGAPKDGKKRVTCIAKDNVMQGCKLFASIFAEIGEEYPDIEKDYAIVDAFTQWLITQPEYYDVCVTTNMFGDIVTDLASVLQGGMGMAVGCNVGDDHAMFEPIHGSAPKHAGKDKVNPMAMILSVAEALEWLGHRKGDDRLRAAARAIEDAVAAVCEAGAPLTYDLVGPDRAAPMSEVGAAIRREIAARLAALRA
ncbi:MAG: isocitrate/isopropylmalate dehydrogenase family protein [Deltaproteobacteria bacterium]|nr:MAG: isocitrate/isopropylmalate dehydrogenase family protein [Deltaproteobacteria bacterium]